MASRQGSPRVFLGPIEIAGVFRGLEQGLREIGVDADARDVSVNQFGYGGSPGRRRHVSRAVAKITRPAGRARRGFARLTVFIRALFRYDVFVIGGTGFWSGRELMLLRRLGKRTVWVFLGSDHRPPYLNGKNVRRSTDPRRLRRETARVAQRVARVERWADEIVAHEASAQFHVRPFVRLLEIGLPILIDRTPADAGDPVRKRDDALTVIHCPTDPFAKGSNEIRAMIRRVQDEGTAIEYREIAGRPHVEVLAAIADADLVIDELYSDTPLGALSAEAAWFGTAPLCGGYLADILRPLADRTVLPLAVVDPEDFEDRLRSLSRDPSARIDLGKKAEAFVRERWSPSSVAERLLRVIQATTPPLWRVDPKSITYVDGYGMPRAERATAVHRLVDTEGVGALMLRHRPDLIELLMSASTDEGD